MTDDTKPTAPFSAYPDLAALVTGDKPSINALPGFPHSAYEVTVPWDHLERVIAHDTAAYGLNLDPDFQRAHVWTPNQRTAYIEYILLGGEASRTLTFGADQWAGGTTTRYELLDGKQRLEAVRAFLRSEVPVFGRVWNQFSGTLRFTKHCFAWRIVELRTRADALKLYLALNIGGTPHAPEEIQRVQALLAQELRLP